MPSFCEVALPVPLDRTFTYAVPDFEQPARGARVIAPFRNEKLIGVVTAIGVAEPTEFEAKRLEAVLDDEPLLGENLLELAEWIAGYYLAPLGEVLRTMLPLMAEVRRTVYYRITDTGRDLLASSLDGDGGKLQSHSSNKRRSMNGAQLVDGAPGVDERGTQRRVLEQLAAGERVKVSTLRTATSASLQVLALMLRRKWIARETSAVERDARRTERFAVLVPDTRLPVLTKLQQAILAELAANGGELPLAELRKKELPSSTLQTLWCGQILSRRCFLSWSKRTSFLVLSITRCTSGAPF